MKYILEANDVFQARMQVSYGYLADQERRIPVQFEFSSPPEEKVDMTGKPLGPRYQAELPK